MKIFYGIILTILIGGSAFFRALDALIRYKNKRVVKRYCEDNGLKFIKAESYELHTRLYFQKDEISSWVNYETDRNYKITWKRETPLEKYEALKLRKK
jgi:hypothetical protein